MKLALTAECEKIQSQNLKKVNRGFINLKFTNNANKQFIYIYIVGGNGIQ